MRRFLSALILVAGLLVLPDSAAAQSGRSYKEPPPSAEERKRQWGELLVLGLIAGSIGLLVVMQGAREFMACLPKGRRPVRLDDDYDD